jgi:hypothetical protein
MLAALALAAELMGAGLMGQQQGAEAVLLYCRWLLQDLAVRQALGPGEAQGRAV